MGINLRLCLLAGVVPLLLVIVLGIRDLGGALQQQAHLDEAAFQGLRWAKRHGYDAGGIAAAAQSESHLSGTNVAPYNPCGCDTDGKIALTLCGATCPGGGRSQPYIFVTATKCYEPTLAWPGAPYCTGNSSQCAAAGCTRSQIVLTSQSIARTE